MSVMLSSPEACIFLARLYTKFSITSLSDHSSLLQNHSPSFLSALSSSSYINWHASWTVSTHFNLQFDELLHPGMTFTADWELDVKHRSTGHEVKKNLCFILCPRRAHRHKTQWADFPFCCFELYIHLCAYNYHDDFVYRMVRAPVKHARRVKLSRLFPWWGWHFRLWDCWRQRQHVPHWIMGQCRVAATCWTACENRQWKQDDETMTKCLKKVVSNQVWFSLKMGMQWSSDDKVPSWDSGLYPGSTFFLNTFYYCIVQMGFLPMGNLGCLTKEKPIVTVALPNLRRMLGVLVFP